MPEIYDNTDFSTFLDFAQPDLDPNFVGIPGRRAVVERAVRRWVTIPGQMDDPEYGFPVFRYLQASIAVGDTAAISSGMAAEAELEEGVDTCDVTITVNSISGKFNGEAVFSFTDGTDVTLIFELSADRLTLITGLAELLG